MIDRVRLWLVVVGCLLLWLVGCCKVRIVVCSGWLWLFVVVCLLLLLLLSLLLLMLLFLFS